ncbi:MAG: inosine monophosphate cyclohydrolase [Clostridiales bacterium]|nr:inosine monophosphate cyclohydrolase [Clostridiales bacterium]
MKLLDLPTLLQNNPYPGRGIVLGMSPDKEHALTVYFIMGRSENSRNRVFVREGDELAIRLHDERKLSDPSLILYRPSATVGNHLIVTNGDQTDTIVSALMEDGSFVSALNTRQFEPDAPNFTPRISGMMCFDQEAASIQMGLLRAADEEGLACDRLYYNYPALPGVGRFIHTYETDGNPLPSFLGEPRQVEIPMDAAAFSQSLWNSLHPDNKVALCVRRFHLQTQSSQYWIYNRHTR